MKQDLNKALLALAGVVLVIVLFMLTLHKVENQKAAAPVIPTQVASAITNAPSRVEIVGSKSAADFTPEERAELEKRFAERFKPAIAKWGNAYAGHLPFNPADITLDKFHSRMVGGFYTFMLGDTTVTILDNKKGTRVFYMMLKQAAHDLNTIPDNAASHDLSVPIKREDVVKMAKADTGIDYQINQIDIKPTAAACAVDGGAFVEVGTQTLGGNMLITEDSLSFVVGHDGKLLTYQH